MDDSQRCTLDRRELVRFVLEDRPSGLLVVSGLGNPAWDVAAAGDHDLNFCLWGAMGSAVTIGLGLAMARPRNRVLVVTGDGELLMALGALASIGAAPAANLAILVLDNEAYGETGGQKSHTGFGTDLSAVAAACNLRTAPQVTAAAAFAGLKRDLLTGKGPLLRVAKVAQGGHERVMPPRDGRVLRERFRKALLG